MCCMFTAQVEQKEAGCIWKSDLARCYICTCDLYCLLHLTVLIVSEKLLKNLFCVCKGAVSQLLLSKGHLFWQSLLLLPHEQTHTNTHTETLLTWSKYDLLSPLYYFWFWWFCFPSLPLKSHSIIHSHMYKHTHTKTTHFFKTCFIPWAAVSLAISEKLQCSEEVREAGSVICPTAWGRGQLEWDSGQLAQRGQQTGAGDSSSLIACRFLCSFCDPCTLEVTIAKQRPLTEAEAAGKKLWSTL